MDAFNDSVRAAPPRWKLIKLNISGIIYVMWYIPKEQDFMEEVSRWISEAPVSNVLEGNVDKPKGAAPQDKYFKCK